MANARMEIETRQFYMSERAFKTISPLSSRPYKGNNYIYKFKFPLLSCSSGHAVFRTVIRNDILGNNLNFVAYSNSWQAMSFMTATFGFVFCFNFCFVFSSCIFLL